MFSAEMVGLVSSDEFPDGYRWVQTVTTNSPDGGKHLPEPITYVDPPGEDDKPFYYDAEQEAKLGPHFQDAPARERDPGGRDIDWQAILSLCGVKGKEVTILDSITYGFTLVVTDDLRLQTTPSLPAPAADLGTHLAALRSEFPDWIFK